MIIDDNYEIIIRHFHLFLLKTFTEMILIGTHNIGFNGELLHIIIYQLSSNTLSCTPDRVFRIFTCFKVILLVLFSLYKRKLVKQNWSNKTVTSTSKHCQDEMDIT